MFQPFTASPPNNAPINLIDNDADANIVAENATNGTIVEVTGFATDPDGNTLTYSLSNDSGGRFAIDANTGIVTVANGTLLDFESNSSHNITIQASDGSLSTMANFTINVGDVNEMPVNLIDSDGAANTINETDANGTAVNITGLATDPDGDTLTYSLTNDAGGRFAIDTNTGVVTIADSSLLNASVNASHSITIEASDGSLTTSNSFTINVNGVNQAPHSLIDNDTDANFVVENAANGTAVEVTGFATDPDGDTLNYSLTNDAGGRFTINANTGVVTVANGTLLDFESNTFHTITIEASDGSLTTNANFTINVGNANETPVNLVDSDADANVVAENAANGTIVEVTGLATDPDGDMLTYSLTNDAAGRFEIDANTGVVTVADGTLLDFEANASHAITIEATDGSLTTSNNFVINIANVNEAPVNLVDSDGAVNTINDTNANGTLVNITGLATDPDGDTLTYSLSDDAGGRFANDLMNSHNQL